MTKLSILEQIKITSDQGYSAKCEIKVEGSLSIFYGQKDGADGAVFNLSGIARSANDSQDIFYFVNKSQGCAVVSERTLEKRINKITGYTFVGNLFGEPKIKEGQKFKTNTGEIGVAIGSLNDVNEVDLEFECSVGQCEKGKEKWVKNKSELEPYFE